MKDSSPHENQKHLDWNRGGGNRVTFGYIILVGPLLKYSAVQTQLDRYCWRNKDGIVTINDTHHNHSLFYQNDINSQKVMLFSSLKMC